MNFFWYNALERAYFFRNPYRMVRRFLQKAEEKDVFQYGETPLSTVQRIVEEFEIPRGATFCDFGCGRGHIPLFLASEYGMRTVGIEQVPTFVSIANKIAAQYELSARFFCQNFLTWEIEPDFVYLYGTCLPDPIIQKLVETPWKRAKWVTVSFPLSDYSSRFHVEKKLLAAYPWGETEVFLNRAYTRSTSKT